MTRPTNDPNTSLNQVTQTKMESELKARDERIATLEAEQASTKDALEWLAQQSVKDAAKLNERIAELERQLEANNFVWVRRVQTAYAGLTQANEIVRMMEDALTDVMRLDNVDESETARVALACLAEMRRGSGNG